MVIQVTKKVGSAIMTALLFLFLPWAIDSSYTSIQEYRYNHMGASDFFLYHNIAPTKDEFRVGEEISFFSFNDTYKPVHYFWNDRLWCDLEGDDKGYHLVGVHQDDFPVLDTPKFHDNENPSPWNFTGAVPMAPGVCYLTSVTTAEVAYGDPKVQIFTGEQFKIVE